MWHVRPVLAPLVALGLLTLPQIASGRETCSSGRWLIDRAVLGLPPPIAITLEGGIVTTAGCTTTVVSTRPSPRGTRLRARWADCSGPLRLRAHLDATCTTMRGRFRASRRRPAFRAHASTCGDGIVDPDVGETCEAGPDCASGLCTSCRCAPPLPDLVVEEDFPPATITPGIPFQIGWEMLNQGTAPASGTWSDRVLLSSDLAPDANDLVLATVVHVGDVAPQVEYPVEVTVTVNDATPGVYNFLYETDADDQVTERDEGNQVLTRPVTVLAP